MKYNVWIYESRSQWVKRIENKYLHIIKMSIIYRNTVQDLLQNLYWSRLSSLSLVAPPWMTERLLFSKIQDWLKPTYGLSNPVVMMLWWLRSLKCHLQKSYNFTLSPGRKWNNLTFIGFAQPTDCLWCNWNPWSNGQERKLLRRKWKHDPFRDKLKNSHWQVEWHNTL